MFKKMKVTKEQFDNFVDYVKSHNGYTLHHIYNRFSIYKQNAYNYCEKLARENNAIYSGVLCGNCMTFSYGFVTEDGRAFKITRDNNYELIVR